MLEELRGQIERITFASEETGYTIARLKVHGRRDLVTAVGNLMSPTPGEVLHMKGEWTSHPKYGEQFKVVYFESKVPATVAGIRKYLGSGLVKGIGPVMAKRIVDKFGKKTLDVIEEQFERLAEVDGIGKKRVGMIKQAWDEQKEIREVMIFLQGHGVSSAYASKIYKQYGDLSIPTVRENPYRLAMDIYGIGFITADKIAEKLGFSKDSPVRAEAGIVYVLNKMSDDGHVFYPYEPLMKKSEETLEVGRDILSEALGKLSSDKKIVIEDMNQSVEEFQENHKAVYLSQFFFCETSIARRMKRLISEPKSIRPADSDKAVDWVQQKLSIRLAKNQREAVESALFQQGHGTDRRTRHGQDHDHQRHIEDFRRYAGPHAARRAHREGGQAHGRNHGAPCKDPASPAGVQLPERRLSKKRGKAPRLRRAGGGRSLHDRYRPDAPPDEGDPAPGHLHPGGRRQPVAVGRTGQRSQGHHRLPDGRRGGTDRDFPAGGRKQNRGQRPSHQLRRLSPAPPKRPRRAPERLLFHSKGRARRCSQNHLGSGGGTDSPAVRLRPRKTTSRCSPPCIAEPWEPPT